MHANYAFMPALKICSFVLTAAAQRRRSPALGCITLRFPVPQRRPPMEEWQSIAAFAADLAESVFSSAFVLALVSAFAGAFAGALGAQRIAERSKRRDDLVREIRNTNAAIIMAVTTANGAIALQKQHVQPLHQHFTAQKRKATEAIAQAAQGHGPTWNHVQADLQLFPGPEAPVEALKEIVFHRLSAYGRALALVAVLEQTVIGLKATIAMRERFVAHFATGQMSEAEFYVRYLGLTDSAGNTRNEYADSVEAISSYTYDMAFFSALLADDLIEHGTKVREKFVKQFKKGAPRISTVDFTVPREKGLIPPQDNYADWLRGFTQQPRAD